jgi:glycosyltransferase involved in cell wall biosynthesis
MQSPVSPNPGSSIVSEELMSRTWLVVPVYNEGEVLGTVIRSALAVFPNIICVDDGSSDESARIASEAGAYVVRHPVNLGQGAALRTGLDFALTQRNAEYFVTFDSDGQHRVEDALAMVKRLDTEPLDVVIGSRFLDRRTQVGVLKRLVLRLAVLFERLRSGVKLSDAHNGLRAFNRTAATVIQIEQNRMAHASEITAQIGRHKLRYAEQPVHVIYSDYSRRKGQSLWNSVNILSDLLFK